MTVPTVERHFAAVRILTTTSAYHLNHERLTAAMRYLREADGSAAMKMRDTYPGMSPADITDHLCAAVLCIDYNIEP
ncbi:hypothetical protein [Micromonospora sp. NBC_00421]|uniref:hypothetical protein n=1 Tax=Micromonospora sp. NBC_00421 TaxID=2975976 RepID=UPI002E22E835